MKLHIVSLISLFIFPLFANASGVVLSTIMFNPSGDDSVGGAGKEWIEIYNGSDAAVDLSGWQLYPDGIGYYSFPNGFSLGAKHAAMIHLRASGEDSSEDLYFSIATGNMGNTSG